MRVRRASGRDVAPRVAAGSASNRSWRRPGGVPEAQKIQVAPPGASWGEKLIDFSFQEAGQERPGASRRACRRAFLRLRFWERPRGRKKYEC